MSDETTLWATDDGLNLRSGPPPGVELEQTGDGRYELIYGTAHGTDFANVSLGDLARLNTVLTRIFTDEATRRMDESVVADRIRSPRLEPLVKALWRAKRDLVQQGFLTSLVDAYSECSDALWRELLVGDSEPLPATTWRRNIHAVHSLYPVTQLLLQHEGGDQWSYLQDASFRYFGPATLSELRIMLADETYKP